MEKVSADDVEETSFAGVTVSRLSGPLSTDDLAINHYRLVPGESFSGGMHAHLDQGEVFYVVEGTATFETESGEIDVAAGEAVRFAPGDYQTGRNDAANDADVVALALGAPKGSTEIRIPQPCPECGDSDALAISFGDDAFELECPECGATFEG